MSETIEKSVLATKGNVNAPVFPTSDGRPNEKIKAVMWNGFIEQEVIDLNSDWYSYEIQAGGTPSGGTSRWANMKAANGSYFVWIPRYAYRFVRGYHIGGEGVSGEGVSGEIDIRFLKGVTNEFIELPEEYAESDTNKITYTGDSQNEWLVHPAFKFGEKELPGLWVAKYKASSSNTNLESGGGDRTDLKIHIKPSVESWGDILIGNAFLNCYNMANDQEEYGFENCDTHMAKNVEWGVFTYLGYSKYGRNKSCIPEQYYGGSSLGSLTGCVYSKTGPFPTYQYNTPQGVLGSLTGNTYGVYDTWGETEYNASILEGESNGDVLTLDYINKHKDYIDIYKKSNDGSSSEDNYKLNSNKKGDGIYETSSEGKGYSGWFRNITGMLIGKGSFLRNDISGYFSFGYGFDKTPYRKFRPVIVPQFERKEEENKVGGEIIPFASGMPLPLTTVGGKAAKSGFVGFGCSAPGLPIKDGIIDITNPSGTLSNFAFIVPSSEVLTDLTAYFSTSTALLLEGTKVIISAQIYESKTLNNEFRSIPETKVTLTPVLSGVLPTGQICKGSLKGIKVDVGRGTRLMLVFTAEAEGTCLNNTILGYASAGLGKSGITKTSTGAMIPFSSGVPLPLTTIDGGETGNSGFLGFGSSATGILLKEGKIDLTNPSGTLTNFAFSIPRAGVITSITVCFSTLSALLLEGTEIIITVQLYSSTTPDNQFTAINGTEVILSPRLTDIIDSGKVCKGGLDGLAINIMSGTRLMLVFTAKSSGISLINTIVGYASAGIEIK